MSDWQGQPPPGSPPPGQGQPTPGGQWGAPHLAAQAGVVRVGDLLQTGARIVGGNLGAFFTVAFLAILPGNALQHFFLVRWQEGVYEFQADMMSGARIGAVPDFSRIFNMADVGGMCMGSALQFVLTYLAQGILMYAVVETLAGRKPPMGQAISRGLARAPSVLITALLLTLAYSAAMIPGVILGMLIVGGAAAAGGGGAGGVAVCCGMPVMFLAMLVPVVFLWVIFFLAIPSAVAEKAGPVEAISRSLALTKGNRLTIFLLGVCLVLVVLVFWGIGSMFLMVVGGAGVDFTTGLPEPPSTISQIVSFIVGLLVGALWTMLVASLSAVAYARIRGIRDGVDASALAEVFS